MRFKNPCSCLLAPAFVEENIAMLKKQLLRSTYTLVAMGTLRCVNPDFSQTKLDMLAWAMKLLVTDIV